MLGQAYLDHAAEVDLQLDPVSCFWWLWPTGSRTALQGCRRQADESLLMPRHSADAVLQTCMPEADRQPARFVSAKPHQANLSCTVALSGTIEVDAHLELP